MSRLVELHARRGTDLASLRAVEGALKSAGLQTLWTEAGEGAGGAGQASAASLAPDLRLVVEDGGDPRPLEGAAGVPLAVLWAGGVPAELPRAIRERLEAAVWVGAPGCEQVEPLARWTRGRPQVVGVPALDGWGPELRRRERAALRIDERTRAWVYAPTAAPGSPLEWFGDELEGFCQPGVLLVLAACGWPAERVEELRAWAARWPGAVLTENPDPAGLLALADAVIGDESPLLFAARALGIGAVLLAPRWGAGEPAGAAWDARSAQRLLDDAPARPDAMRLEHPGESAGRVAQALAEWLRDPAGVAPPAEVDSEAREETGPGATGQSWADRIEAQIGFGDLRGAREALEARAKGDPSPGVQRRLAQVYRLEGELDAAERAALGAGRAAQAEWVAALCEQAKVEVERGAFEAARERFERALDLDPEGVDAAVGLGSLALHAEDGAGAEVRFRQALRREKSVRVWSGLGLSLCAQGRDREALAPLVEALELDGAYPPALYGLVQAGYQTGELAIAQERLRTYVAEHPGNLGFAYSLAGISLQRGDLDEARECVERIELFDPGYPGLADLRAKLES